MASKVVGVVGKEIADRLAYFVTGAHSVNQAGIIAIDPLVCGGSAASPGHKIPSCAFS